jgi:predicted glycosyltransferase
MNIVIDLVHPADVNFYKNSINILMKRNVGVNLIVRPRGRLLSILQKEFPHTDPKIIGKHYSNIHGKIVGLIKRELELLFYLNKIDFDVSLGGFMIGYASRILRKPCVTFEDDYEYKIPFYLAKFTATRHVMPECIPATGKNMYKYKGLKEIAYLHPRYFKPDKEILEQYKLRPQEYVFIREIANTSLNYKDTSAKLHEITE